MAWLSYLPLQDVDTTALTNPQAAKTPRPPPPQSSGALTVMMVIVAALFVQEIFYHSVLYLIINELVEISNSMYSLNHI